MAHSRQDKVAAAIDSIRKFHAAGQESLESRPGRGSYGKGAVAEEAARLGMNADTLGKARQFADPSEGYTEDELEELCDQVARQVDAEPGHAVFGKTHVIRLLSVPKNQRAAVQKRAIEEGWSTAQLENEIGKRLGTRGAGGRRPTIPPDRLGVYTLLEQKCEHWRRWFERFEQDTQAGDRKGVRFKDVPLTLRQQLRRAVKALRLLQQGVSEELKQIQPSREERAPSQDEDRMAERKKTRRKPGREGR